jgi:hypothetical protein
MFISNAPILDFLFGLLTFGYIAFWIVIIYYCYGMLQQTKKEYDEADKYRKEADKYCREMIDLITCAYLERNDNKEEDLMDNIIEKINKIFLMDRIEELIFTKAVNMDENKVKELNRFMLELQEIIDFEQKQELNK